MPIELPRTSKSSVFCRNVRIAGILIPILLFFLCSFSSAAGGLEIIANPKGATESLDASTLRGIFGMHMTRWPDGTPIKVFVLPDDNPEHEKFAKTFLNTYPHQLRRNWDRLVFSGTGNAPIKVEDEQEMLKMIRSTPGAIGYVESVEESANVHVIETR